MAAVVLPGRHAPEHEGQLEEGEGGREVELVQEQLAQEHEGEHQPVPAEVVSLVNVKAWKAWNLVGTAGDDIYLNMARVLEEPGPDMLACCSVW